MFEESLDKVRHPPFPSLGWDPNFFLNSEIGGSPYLKDDLALPGSDQVQDWAR